MLERINHTSQDKIAIRKILLLVLPLICSINAHSQNSWSERLYFNIRDTSGHIITPDDVINQNVRFYSPSSRYDYIYYDGDIECFVYNHQTATVNNREGNIFYIISGNRIAEIRFCRLVLGRLLITTPIIIDNLTYDFVRLASYTERGPGNFLRLPADDAVISIADNTAKSIGELVKFLGEMVEFNRIK